MLLTSSIPRVILYVERWRKRMFLDIEETLSDEEIIAQSSRLLTQYVILEFNKYEILQRILILDEIMVWLNERAYKTMRFPCNLNDISEINKSTGYHPNKWAMKYTERNQGAQFWIENDDLRTEFMLTWK